MAPPPPRPSSESAPRRRPALGLPPAHALRAHRSLPATACAATRSPLSARERARVASWRADTPSHRRGARRRRRCWPFASRNGLELRSPMLISTPARVHLVRQLEGERRALTQCAVAANGAVV